MILTITKAELTTSAIIERNIREGDVIKFDFSDVDITKDGFPVSPLRGENASAFYARGGYYSTQYGAFRINVDGTSDIRHDLYEVLNKSKSSEPEYVTAQSVKGTGNGGNGNSYTKDEIDSKLVLKADSSQVDTLTTKVDTLTTRVDNIEASGGSGGTKIYSNFPPLPNIYDTSSSQVLLANDANKWTAKLQVTTDTAVKYEGQNTVKFDHQSGQQSPYGSYVLASPIDLSSFDYIEVMMFVKGGDHIGTSSRLRLHSGAGAFVADMYRYINAESGQKEGWKRIRINKSAFTIETGTPLWNSIDKVFMAFTISQTAVASINIAKISNVNVQTGMLNIDFDDSLESVYNNAFPIMNKYNLKGNIYAITSRIGTAGYLTWSQLQEFRQAGWTIGSHTDLHQDLNTLTREQIAKEFDDSQRKLRQHGFYSGSYFFAAPQGNWSDTAREEALSRFLYSRVFRQTPAFDSIPCDDPLLSSYRSVLKADTVEKVKGEVDMIIANKQCYNMTFHDIGAINSGGWDWTIQNFDDICKYISEKRDAGVLKVLTAEEKVLQFYGQECNFNGKHSVLSSDGISPVMLKLNRQ